MARTAAAPVAISSAQDADAAQAGDDHPEEEERALIDKAQRGDMQAFRQLYERHASAVLRFAILPMVRDRTLGEDLLADTFVRALENLHRFRWQGKGALPWLIRIAKNRCLDHLRRSGRIAAWPVGLEQLLPDPTEWNSETMVARTQVADLLRERIADCLEAINPRYRKVLRLRLIEGDSRQRAAARMKVTIGTLDVLLFRACRAFRRVYLERYGSGPTDPEVSTL